MESRDFNTTITYQNNCNYKKSSKDVVITLPLREPTITFLDFVDCIEHTETLYYNDPIEIGILVKDNDREVKWGHVIFYFVDKDDVDQEMQQINTNPIPIDINGNATIQYIPHTNGTIYAKYTGHPYYKDVMASCELPLLASRPTYIEFNKLAPHLIDEEETVTMNVTVKDKLNNELLEYGIVTFLNYHSYGINDATSGEEKVIGNPKYLKKGQADITYSPIQLGTNDLISNIELIRASYNYDNEAYGLNWHYYLEHDDWTSIAIRRDNQMNLYCPIKNNEQVQINEDGVFSINKGESVICRCEITLNANSVITDAVVSFVVEGTEIIYNGEDKTKRKYKEIYPAEYVQNKNYFQTVLSNLPMGSYEIYAQVENPTHTINNETIDVPIAATNVTTTDNLPTQNRSQVQIEDGIYIKSNVSESFSLNVEPIKTSFTLTLASTETFTTNKTINKNNITLTFNGPLTQDDIHILTGKECYFWIPSINETYKGVIQYTNNKLIAHPNSNIILNNVGDYRMYAYIGAGQYTYTNGQTTIVREYPSVYSNDILLRSRKQLVLNLRKNEINIAYPGDIKYIVDIEDLTIDTINVNIYIDNVLIGSHDLTKLAPKITKSLPELEVGTHTLKATVTNTEYSSIVKTTNITIEKSDLSIYINNISKNIYASLQGDLIFIVQRADGKNIHTLQASNFIATIKDPEDNIQIIQNTNGRQDIKINELNSQYYQVIVTGRFYDDGIWKAKLDYNGDNHYNATNNKNTNINVTNKEPFYVVKEATEDFIKNKIVFAIDTEYTIDQHILVSTTIYNNQKSLTFTHITNTNGEYTINNNTQSTWSEYNEMDIAINAKHNILNIFATASSQNSAITAFKSAFPNHQCSDSEIIQLYNQAQDNNFKNLFLGYNSIAKTIEYEVSDGS